MKKGPRHYRTMMKRMENKINYVRNKNVNKIKNKVKYFQNKYFFTTNMIKTENT